MFCIQFQPNLPQNFLGAWINSFIAIEQCSVHVYENVHAHSSPMISTSVCNSIPRSALALAFKIEINSKTSRAVALPSFTMKLPCSAETTAPPTRAPFNPSSSTSLPAGIAPGFLKMQPALGAAGCDPQRFSLNDFIRFSISSREELLHLKTAPSAM